MEPKDPITRTATSPTSADSAEAFLGEDGFDPWSYALTWVARLAIFLAGFGTARVTSHPKPAPAPILSTRQSVVPVVLDGCSYWFATFGEPTNANWSASLTHSGSCTNWIAHKALSQ